MRTRYDVMRGESVTEESPLETFLATLCFFASIVGIYFLLLLLSV